MKPITLHSKKISTLSDGRPCTPYSIDLSYCGFIGFHKSFTNKWFSNTLYQGVGVVHILGFRFIRWVKY